MHRVYNTMCTSMMREEPLSLSLSASRLFPFSGPSSNENTVFSLRFVHRICTNALTHFPFSSVCASFLFTSLLVSVKRSARNCCCYGTVSTCHKHTFKIDGTDIRLNTDRAYIRSCMNIEIERYDTMRHMYNPSQTLRTVGKRNYMFALGLSLSPSVGAVWGTLQLSMCVSRCYNWIPTPIEWSQCLRTFSLKWSALRFRTFTLFFRVLTRRSRTLDANKFRCDFDSIRRAVNENQGLSSISKYEFF